MGIFAFLRCALVGVILAISFPAVSLASSIVCKITTMDNPFYIAPESRIELGGFGEVQVSDSIITSTGRKVVIGQVVVDTAKRISIRWDVQNVKRDPKEARFRNAHLVVRLTIQRSGGSAVVTIIDAQNRLDYRGTGTCKFSQ